MLNKKFERDHDSAATQGSSLVHLEVESGELEGTECDCPETSTCTGQNQRQAGAAEEPTGNIAEHNTQSWVGKLRAIVPTCFLKCIRVVAKRKRTTVGLTATVLVSSFIQIVLTSVFSQNIEEESDDHSCSDSFLQDHSPFWFETSSLELRCSWPSSNDALRGTLSGILLGLTVYLLIAMALQWTKWLEILGLSVFLIGVIVIFSWISDITRLNRANKACRNGDISDHMSRDGECRYVELSLIPLVSCVQLVCSIYNGIVIILFKKEYYEGSFNRIQD